MSLPHPVSAMNRQLFLFAYVQAGSQRSIANDKALAIADRPLLAVTFVVRLAAGFLSVSFSCAESPCEFVLRC